MKRNLLGFSFLILAYITYAQPYGNEWIDYTKNYYKIRVAQDGIYRIGGSTLAGVIPNLGTLNTSSFAMYHNGQPVPLYISSNTTLGPNDYIEFYGERNLGFIDSLLYRSAEDQINPAYSLFNDTSVYFLTANNFTNNLRFVEVNNDLSFPLPAKENYFIDRAYGDYGTRIYFPGNYFSLGGTEIYKSIYDVGEGYTNGEYFGGSPQSYPIPTPFVYSQGPDATLRVYYANNSGGGFETHEIDIRLNGVPIYHQPNSFGFKLNRLSMAIPVSSLPTSNNSLSLQDIGAGPSQHKNIVGTVELDYPRQFHFGNQDKFYFRMEGGSGSRYLEINGFNDRSTRPILYDLTNNKFYRATSAGTLPIKFKILASGPRAMYLRADTSATLLNVSEILPVTFTNPAEAEYYIISHKSLMDNNNGNDPVGDYKSFRSARYGQCQIADIEMLYDEFGYGIRKSPLAIRNFIHYAKDSWTLHPLKYVFLIGKGRESPSIRNGGPDYKQCLIPTFGYPGSDNLLSVFRNSDTASVAIGRLAAESRDTVRNYLEKMILYEAEQTRYTNDQPIPPKDWQKQILHFSGGSGNFQQLQFKNYLNAYAQIAKDTFWGTNATAFSKISDQPIDQSLSQIIKEKINNGVSWITFFGHSATGAFDFSIDEPENYTNSPRFPIILSNGCFSGFIHDVSPGYSERFVFARNKAAIAFMATSGLSDPTGLDIFSSALYKNICRKNYVQPLGRSFQQAFNDVNLCCRTDDRAMGVAYEMTLHGDPGLMVNQYPKPDYAIDSTSIFFNPASVTPGTDSFEVHVVVENLGKAIVDTVDVTIQRTVFDASNNGVPVIYIYKKYIIAPYYKDTVIFKLPTQVSTLGYGQNYFDAHVDADHHIDEMAECNNGIDVNCPGGAGHSANIYIQNDDIIPIYPYEFAIVPRRDVTLKASTINPFAPLRDYIFEIDTSELFATQSPYHQISIINHSGGVVPWSITLPATTDSTVYYWRVKKKDVVDAAWHYSSFIYLANEYEDGWNQSHYFQWQKDDYRFMSLDSNTRIFKFPPTTNNIHVLTGWSNAVGGNIYASTLGWDLNNVDMHRFRMGGCGFLHGITFAVIDPNSATLPVWTSINQTGTNFGQFGNLHCADKAGPQYGFDFLTSGPHPSIRNKLWSEVIRDFLRTIPNGDYVLIYSDNLPPYTLWDSILVSAMDSVGFTQAQDFKDGNINGPFIFFNQVGTGNSYFVPPVSNGNYLTPVQGSFNFNATWNRGQFTTPKIGPALAWYSVHWKHTPLNNQFTDIDTLDIIGVKNNGTEIVLQSTVLLNNYLVSPYNIDPLLYPYLKLRLRTRDDIWRTPTQLDYWRVLYKKPPEAAINPSRWFKFEDSTLSIGKNIHLEIGLENVTDIPMDSMLTKYTIRDASYGTHNYSIRYDSLRALAVMHLTIDTMPGPGNFVGLDKIIVEANPDNDQIEQYHFNNFAEIDFKGLADKINPLLDVTFDNQHIMNGDIVSAKPDILITLKDENKYLALDTNAVIDVYLKYPGTSTPVKINYDNAILSFYPPNAANLAKSNKAMAEFKPILTADGVYELIIRDHDRSMNTSSTDLVNEGNLFYDYKITFEVINKPMITNVLNYPNPFTTSTKFIFTITGSEIPDILKIQIITIKGTVVKEINKDEIGDLHVGRNISQYAWDGRDQYGDLLANGVYFYHVVARLDEKRMDHMNQSYDKYFKKGFGKLVIIR